MKRKRDVKLTVSGFNAPADSTLKKNLFGCLFSSQGASCLSSANSKIYYGIDLYFCIQKQIYSSLYQNVLNVAILQVLDKLYDEDYCLDHIQMKHPKMLNLLIF